MKSEIERWAEEVYPDGWEEFYQRRGFLACYQKLCEWGKIQAQWSNGSIRLSDLLALGEKEEGL